MTRCLAISMVLAFGACGGGSDSTVDAGPPGGWTCDPRGYGDGVLCHCECGIPDPDCTSTDVLVSGCNLGDICTPEGMCSACGNGEVDEDEACDSALTATAECAPMGYQDGQVPCGASCQWAYDQCEPLLTCNNGQLDTGELCDGDAIAADRDCSDYGRTSGELACTSGCAIDASGCYTCGDGNLEGPEICDDDDTTGNDGCSATCMPETGWTCTGEPSACVPTCGDGMRVGNETCDDGDAFGNDGCSATCQTETDCTCTGTPSVCTCATVQVIATQNNYESFETASLVLDDNGQPHVIYYNGVDYTNPVTNYLEEHAHLVYAHKPATTWTTSEIQTWDQLRTTPDRGDISLAYDGGTLRAYFHRIYNAAGTFAVATRSGSSWQIAYDDPYYIYDADRAGGAWHLIARNTNFGEYRYLAGAPGALTIDEPAANLQTQNVVRIAPTSTGDIYATNILEASGRASYNLRLSRRTGPSTWETVYDVPTTGTCVFPVFHEPVVLPGGGVMTFEDGFNSSGQRWLKAHRKVGTSWVVENVADLAHLDATCMPFSASYRILQYATGVDAQGQPHILFAAGPTDGSMALIDYYRTSTGWQSRDFPLTRGRPLDMVIDANGATHIVAETPGATSGSYRLVYIRVDANAW